MARSQRSHEGYLLVDDTASGGQRMEQPFRTCRHCQCVCLIHPARTIPLDYCAKCDAYLCRACAQEFARTGICRPLTQIFDELQEAAIQEEQASRGLVLLPGEV